MDARYDLAVNDILIPKPPEMIETTGRGDPITAAPINPPSPLFFAIAVFVPVLAPNASREIGMKS